MNAPTYINTRLDFEKYNQYTLDLHRKRLREIKGKIPKLPSSAKVMKKLKPIITPEILEQNRKLVKKLINIAKQRQSHSLTPSQSTLNYFSRKKEFERIEQENHKLLTKIKNCSGDVRAVDLEKGFTQSQEYKSRISRSYILKKRQSSLTRSDRRQGFMSSINLFNN
jgi:uncharacterized ubiquitin-like protein YukD